VTLIAIDGPAGAGKSSVAAAVAARLGLDRLDTGAMYRATTLAALRAGVDPGDGTALGKLLAGATIDVNDRVLLDGTDVTSEIRSPEVTATVSQVSAHPEVRQELVARQRAWVEERGGSGVVEGRDIGSVVFPEATLKIYLTASTSERARRRADQEGQAAPAAGAVEAALVARDSLDSSRQASPLAVAPGAHVIDSTVSSLDETVEEVLDLLRTNGGTGPEVPVCTA
jgi:cytidylate kinase